MEMSPDTPDPMDTPFQIETIPESELDRLQFQLDHFDQFFNWGNKLGQGSYGLIYQVIAKDGQEYAIKLFPLDGITPKLQRMIDTESEIIHGFQIPHVITYYARGSITMGLKRYMGILMDYIPGQTLESIRENSKTDPFTEYEILKLMRQALIGIGSLHELNIAHRDIKAENAIFDGQDLTIIDLGLACCHPCPNGSFQCAERKGTPLFMPPELFELTREELYDIPINFLKAGDIWAFGVTFFYLIYNVFPYDADSYKQFVNKIRNHEMTLVPPKPGMSRALDVIDNAMLPLDDRPTADDLIGLVDDYLDEFDEEEEAEEPEAP